MFYNVEIQTQLTISQFADVSIVANFEYIHPSNMA